MQLWWNYYLFLSIICSDTILILKMLIFKTQVFANVHPESQILLTSSVVTLNALTQLQLTISSNNASAIKTTAWLSRTQSDANIDVP